MQVQSFWRRLIRCLPIGLLLFVAAAGPASAQNNDAADDEFQAEPLNERAYIDVDIRPGSLTTVLVTDQPVEWMNLESLLLEGKFQADEGSMEAEVRRPPQDGKAYVILNVEVKQGKSLGKYDYRLAADGNTVECLAVAPGTEGRFDPRQWEIVADDRAQMVRMLFEVNRPGLPFRATLVSALDTTVALVQKDFELAAKAAPPAAAVEPADETPDNEGTPEEQEVAEADEPTVDEETPVEEAAEEPVDTPEQDPEPTDEPEQPPAPEPVPEEEDDDDGELGLDDLW